MYICVKKKTSERFYIGYRYKNRLPSSEDFGTHYFTSNKFIKENFNKFDYYIEAEFFNKVDAYESESQLITETRSEYQINYEKNVEIRPYVKSEKIIIPEKKICPLVGCGKEHTNWRLKCCCISHNKKICRTSITQ